MSKVAPVLVGGSLQAQLAVHSFGIVGEHNGARQSAIKQNLHTQHEAIGRGVAVRGGRGSPYGKGRGSGAWQFLWIGV